MLWCGAVIGQPAVTPLSFEVVDVQVSKPGGPEPSANVLEVIGALEGRPSPLVVS
jgi:hypothetical protein